jgi:hypothetical protein
MEKHLFILSTMSPELTRKALGEIGLEFQTERGIIQKFKWGNAIQLWVACHHPVVAALADSILPHMDVVVCWYHNKCAKSCLRVHNSMEFLSKYHHNIVLMATAVPALDHPRKSLVRKYYNNDGFVRKYYNQTFAKNVLQILENED